MDICVVHLIREKNGISTFKSFLNSYLNHKTGLEHNLLFLFKKNNKSSSVNDYYKVLKNIPHQFLIIPDNGFDIDAYFIAARKTNFKYYLFLNSFSIINSDNWLLKMYSHLSKPDVGLVGTSASFSSICPQINFRKLFRQEKRNLIYKARKLSNYLIIFLYPILRFYYGHFPNPHIRTNGFMISRDHLLKLNIGRIYFKFQAWLFESGRNSLSKRIEELGLKVLVIGNDGKAYDKCKWKISNTFCISNQQNLMIEDNQTRKYQFGSNEEKTYYQKLVWGR